MLQVKNARAGYADGPDVLKKVSIEVSQGEIVALVGLNGAGKSTLVKLVGGLLATRGGDSTFLGEDITHMSADGRARRGLMLVPEGRQLFPSMTVAETLMLGTVPIVRSKRKQMAKEAYDKVFELFPALADRRARTAGTLSGGEQQMLAIARALMSSPKLLVLDEPSLGLAPQLVDQIFAVLESLNRDGLSILLVEQNATIALGVSSRAYVLEFGRVSRSAPSGELSTSDVMSHLGSTGMQTTEAGSEDINLEGRPGLPAYSGVLASTHSHRNLS